MDYRTHHVPGPRFAPELTARYPYLGWAEAHFHGEAPLLALQNQSYPLTWEAEASQADYRGMARISEEYVKRKISVPHMACCRDVSVSAQTICLVGMPIPSYCAIRMILVTHLLMLEAKE